MSVLLAFLSALVPLILKGVLGWIGSQDAEEAPVKEEAKIAQAVVAAPKGKAEIISALNAGSF